MKERGLALSAAACPFSFFCGAVKRISEKLIHLNYSRHLKFYRGYGDRLLIIFAFGLVLWVARKKLRFKDCPKLPICHLKTCKGTGGVKEREWTSFFSCGLSIIEVACPFTFFYGAIESIFEFNVLNDCAYKIIEGR